MIVLRINAKYFNTSLFSPHFLPKNKRDKKICVVVEAK